MVQKIAGIDVGYRYVVEFSMRGQSKFPAVVAPVSQSALTLGMVDMIDSREEIEYQGQLYLVGNKAAARTRQAERTSDHSRLGSDEFMVLFLAALARAFPDGGRAYVVTGLPMAQMYMAEQLKDTLSGKHAIQIGGENLKFDISAKVIPQTLGTLTRETFALDGHTLKVLNRDLMAQSSLMVDWGGLTDGYQRFIGRDLIEDESTSTDTGILMLLQQLVVAVGRDYGVRLSLDEADTALQTGSVYHAGGDIDISKLTGALLKTKATASAKVARSLWGDGGRNHRLFMTGGGAYLLSKYFTKEYPHPGAIVVREPDLANAEGFFLYGYGLDMEGKWK